MPAASALMPTPASAANRCRDESRHGRHECLRHITFSPYAIDQPLRTVGTRYLLASTLLVIFIFAGSYSSLPSARRAITPSSIHSTNGAATLKLEQAGSPPLQARIQSR